MVHDTLTQQLLLDSLPEVVLLLGTGGEMRYVNQMGLTVFRYSREELIGKNPSIMVSPDEHFWLEAALSRAARGDRVKGDITAVTRDGRNFPASISFNPVIAGGEIKGIGVILSDITTKKAVENTLMKSEERLRRLSDMALEGIVICENGKIVDSNDAFCKMFCYEISELVGKDLKDFIQLNSPEVSGFDADFKGIRKYGELFDIEFSMRPLPHENESVFAAVVQDISYRKRLEFMEDHDELTGLLNKKGFTKMLRQKMSFIDVANDRIAVVTVRLEHDELTIVKNVRPELERVLLNSVPMEIAERLRSSPYECEAVARIDKLEYLTMHLLPQEDDHRNSVILVDRLLELFSKEFVKGIRMIPRIGVTFYPDDLRESNPVMLVKNSGYACDEALEKKREYILYDEHSQKEMTDRIQFDRDLILAVREEECANFHLHYQPKVTKDGRIAGMEALIRWDHQRWNDPENGLVSASKLVMRAEEIGLIGEIGNWVLREACRQTKKWHDMSRRWSGLQVAVNVSPSQLNDRFESLIEDILQDTGLAPEFLELEITERETVKKKNLEILYRIKARSISIAIDDFGMDYSSLNKLPKLSVDTIKLDKSYIANVASDADYENLVYYTIKMVHGFHFKVVAEGVEDEEQMRKLFFEMDCDKIQGYYYFRPMSAEDFEKVLRENLGE